MLVKDRQENMIVISKEKLKSWKSILKECSTEMTYDRGDHYTIA